MHCKSYSHFFSKKFQHIWVSLNVNFKESLSNDIVSFEQLGPDDNSVLNFLHRKHILWVLIRSAYANLKSEGPPNMSGKNLYWHVRRKFVQSNKNFKISIHFNHLWPCKSFCVLWNKKPSDWCDDSYTAFAIGPRIFLHMLWALLDKDIYVFTVCSRLRVQILRINKVIFIGLKFNSPVNTIKVMSNLSIYLTTFFLGTLSPLNSLSELLHILSQKTTVLLESEEAREWP